MGLHSFLFSDTAQRKRDRANKVTTLALCLNFALLVGTSGAYFGIIEPALNKKTRKMEEACAKESQRRLAHLFGEEVHTPSAKLDPNGNCTMTLQDGTVLVFPRP